MKLFGPKFKPGDRVVYVNKELNPGAVGEFGTVTASIGWHAASKYYRYAVKYDDGDVSFTRQHSLKRLKMSRFEKSLRAYIAKEKLALGIS